MTKLHEIHLTYSNMQCYPLLAWMMKMMTTMITYKPGGKRKLSIVSVDHIHNGLATSLMYLFIEHFYLTSKSFLGNVQMLVLSEYNRKSRYWSTCLCSINTTMNFWPYQWRKLSFWRRRRSQCCSWRWRW